MKAVRTGGTAEDQVPLWLDPNGFWPIHVDILKRKFDKLNMPHDNRIYFVQDLNVFEEKDVEELKDPRTQDEIINEAIELLQDPRVQEILAKIKSQS